jgi:hypothetical protein
MACFGLAHEETVSTVSAFATDTLNGAAKNDNAATPNTVTLDKLELFIVKSPLVTLLFLNHISTIHPTHPISGGNPLFIMHQDKKIPESVVYFAY